MDLTSKLLSSPDGRQMYQQEVTILELTELICKEMDKQGYSAYRLSLRLGETEKYVRKILAGGIDLNIRMISDIFMALGLSIHFSTEKLE